MTDTKEKFGYRTARGWHFDDLYQMEIIGHSSDKSIKDDYAGAFKPNESGTPHPTGLGTVSSQQAAAPQTQTGLIVKIAATHAGLITRNNGLYMPDKMRAAVSTWTEHYPKPIQLHHNDAKDPIGRVISARYVDTTGPVIDKFQNSKLRDSFGNEIGKMDAKFWDKFNSDRVSFFEKLNLLKMMDSVLDDPHYHGVGYIELTANITDPEAIQKILDGRYFTGSVGAVSDKAVCSVCHTDWLEEEHCGHRPGRVYDGKRCTVIAGNLEYDEYSFVNIPADRHSALTEMQIQNSMKNTDSVLELQTVFNMEDSNMSGNKDLVEINDSVSEVATNETPSAEKTEVLVDSAQESNTEEKPAEVDAAQMLMDKVMLDGKLTDEEREGLYELMLAEMDQGVVQDAKLSAEKRKKLAKSTFCGPDRSFPVPDCAHVTAARRLIGRYKGEGSKSTILACVERKAKALGCESKDAVTPETKVADSVQPEVQVQETVQSVEQDFTFSSKVQGEVTDQVKLDLSKTLLEQMVEKFGKDALQNAALALGIGLNPADKTELEDSVKALEDEVAKNEDLIGSLRDQLQDLRRELKAAYEDVIVVEDQLIGARAQIRDAKLEKAKTLYLLDGTLNDAVTSSLADATEEALTNTIKTLTAKVDITKIVDKLNSGLSRTPEGTVEVPVGLTEPITETKTVQEPTYAMQQWVDDVYRRTLLSQGHKAAQAFYLDAVKRGMAKSKE